MTAVRTRFDVYARRWAETYRGRTRRGITDEGRAYILYVIETFARFFRVRAAA